MANEFMCFDSSLYVFLCRISYVQLWTLYLTNKFMFFHVVILVLNRRSQKISTHALIISTIAAKLYEYLVFIIFLKGACFSGKNICFFSVVVLKKEAAFITTGSGYVDT